MQHFRIVGSYLQCREEIFARRFDIPQEAVCFGSVEEDALPRRIEGESLRQKFNRFLVSSCIDERGGTVVELGDDFIFSELAIANASK